MITVLFFGVLAEKTANKKIELPDFEDLSQLDSEVRTLFPDIQDYKYQISVNQALTHDNLKLASGDEVAFLPPFAGG